MATGPARIPPVSLPQRPPEKLRLLMLSDPRGVHDFPGVDRVIVSVHVGRAVEVACTRGGESHRGRAVHGDIDIIPRGMASRWVNEGLDTVFVISLAPEVLEEAAQNTTVDPCRMVISNRFQTRDTTLENLAWTLKAEMDKGFPSGRLFLDSMAATVASQLIGRHSSLSQPPRLPTGGLAPNRLKQVLAFIEENLNQDLSLEQIAQVARVSVSHCKVQFRKSVGMPAHQYVIRRRVERATELLAQGKLPISQIALEAGFSHQSHLARHMRRLLGVTPKLLQDRLQ